jgi:hypothetical protein
LLSDTASFVVMLDIAGHAPQCKEQRHITAEPIPAAKPGTIEERWHVERCGTAKYYHITFTPTPATGGTDFSVQAEP